MNTKLLLVVLFALGISVSFIAAPAKAALFTGNVTQGQVERIVKKYLQEHPKDLHEGRWALTVKALVDAFPCSTKE